MLVRPRLGELFDRVVCCPPLMVRPSSPANSCTPQTKRKEHPEEESSEPEDDDQDKQCLYAVLLKGLHIGGIGRDGGRRLERLLRGGQRCSSGRAQGYRNSDKEDPWLHRHTSHIEWFPDGERSDQNLPQSPATASLVWVWCVQPPNNQKGGIQRVWSDSPWFSDGNLPRASLHG
jgi:hypothetical protein